MNFKKGCGIGCLALFTVAVILAGAATWYTRDINREYKAVQRTENALLAATGSTPFLPPADLVPDPARLDAFLAVRDSLDLARQELEAAAVAFAREKDRTRGGGLRGFLSLLGSGSDLAPVYAGYWLRRNQALLAHEMGPDEYIWFYSLVYYTWLGKDPADGQRDLSTAAPVQAMIADDLPAATLSLMAPRRLRLEAGYSALVNPVELIFAAHTP